MNGRNCGCGKCVTDHRRQILGGGEPCAHVGRIGAEEIAARWSSGSTCGRSGERRVACTPLGAPPPGAGRGGVVAENGARADPRRDDERGNAHAERPDRKSGRPARGRWRYVVVEAAVLVVDDQQKSLVPGWPRDHRLHDALHEAWPSLTSRAARRSCVGRVVDEVRIDESHIRQLSGPRAREKADMRIVGRDDVGIVEGVALEES